MNIELHEAVVGLKISATGYRGEIVSPPRLKDGVWCVLVTGCGEWEPLSKFTKQPQTEQDGGVIKD